MLEVVLNLKNHKYFIATSCNAESKKKVGIGKKIACNTWTEREVNSFPSGSRDSWKIYEILFYTDICCVPLCTMRFLSV